MSLDGGVSVAAPALPANGKFLETKSPRLIADLLEALRDEQISYCHWKSNWKIDDWLAGKGDLDLLVRREDVLRFVAIISRLGFKRALVTPEKDLPGVVNYYGYDVGSQRFVHIHAHYQLVLGHDATKNYRFPVEGAMLETAVMHGPIRIASPEFELAVFVMRMTLKYSPSEWLARHLTGKLRRHNQAIVEEAEYLRTRIDVLKLQYLMRQHFPTIGRQVFDDCLNALRLDASTAEKIRAANSLKSALTPLSRSGRVREILIRSRERLTAVGRRLFGRQAARKLPENGGSLIALVGGDGSGKTTCANDLNRWLGKKFETRRIHFGKPPKSLTTWALVGALRVQRWANSARSIGGRGKNNFDPFKPEGSFFQQLRWLSTARDRHRLFTKIRRFTSNGGIAICDRLPVDKLQLMDGPRIARSLNGTRPSCFQRFLIERENFYYRQMTGPNLLIVLRVDAATAAARKANEPAEHVLPRAEELWRVDWSGTGAHVIDANRPLADVFSEIRALVWKQI